MYCFKQSLESGKNKMTFDNKINLNLNVTNPFIDENHFNGANSFWVHETINFPYTKNTNIQRPSLFVWIDHTNHVTLIVHFNEPIPAISDFRGSMDKNNELNNSVTNFYREQQRRHETQNVKFCDFQNLYLINCAVRNIRMH
jgi:hypothetical protein